MAYRMNRALGMAGCDSDIGTCCDSCAKGGSCGEGLLGMGLFESGFDVSGWGWPEIALATIGGYMLLSTIFTTSRAVRSVRAMPGERRKRRAAALRAKASELTREK